MSSSQSQSPTVNVNKSVCAKCGRPPFQSRYPLVQCSQCNKLFHTKCVIKTYAGNTQYFSCADCKEKCTSESKRESKHSRLSSAVTLKTNVRKSAGSSVPNSAPRQGGNSNVPCTTKTPSQTTSPATGVHRVSGL